MEKFKAFCKRKNIEVSAKRYGIDALGAMAQGLFCSLLIGTIIKTLGAQLGVPFLTDIGTYAMSVSGPAMAVAIGYALKADPMVLFSLAAVGWAANAEGGAGGPLAVLIIAILAAECGKAVSKETKIDILVTPAVTILVGVALAKWIAPPIGTAASAFGLVIDNATRLQPFWMGIAVSVLVGVALTLPISSAAICAVLKMTGLAGGAAVAGCCAFFVLHLVTPEALHPLMGPLGGLCLGFCTDYLYKTAMNCFGALMLGTGIYGLQGAVILRIADTFLGVTFGLVFAALFHQLAAVRLLPDPEAE